MKLIKEYVSEKETIFELLEDIQNFIDKMEIFKTDHPLYSYKIDIKRSTSERNKKWIVVLKVNKDDKSTNGTRLKRAT